MPIKIIKWKEFIMLMKYHLQQMIALRGYNFMFKLVLANFTLIYNTQLLFFLYLLTGLKSKQCSR